MSTHHPDTDNADNANSPDSDSETPQALVESPVSYTHLTLPTILRV